MIFTSEPALLRREQAVKHGATRAFDPLNIDVPDAIMKATGGRGVDIAFDAAGVQASLDAAMLSVRPRGVVVNVAIWEKKAIVNMNLIVVKEIQLTGGLSQYALVNANLFQPPPGTAAYDRVHPELLEAIAAGTIPGLEELITSKIAIDDVVEKGFRVLLEDKGAQGLWRCNYWNFLYLLLNSENTCSPLKRTLILALYLEHPEQFL